MLPIFLNNPNQNRTDISNIGVCIFPLDDGTAHMNPLYILEVDRTSVAFAQMLIELSTVGFEPTPSTKYGQVLPHYTMQISLTVSTNVDQPFCNVACLTSCKKAIHRRLELRPLDQLSSMLTFTSGFLLHQCTFSLSLRHHLKYN